MNRPSRLAAAAVLDAATPSRDFDSMDQRNFVVGLHHRLGVDVPEADCPQLATLDGCVAYLLHPLRTVPR